MMRLIYLILIFFLLLSCKETEKDRTIRLINEWNGKAICYPDKMNLTSYNYNPDSVVTKYGKDQSLYTILNYVDSTGCLSCRLQLPKWKEVIEEIDSISSCRATCLFVFHPKNKDKLVGLLRKERFNSFVYIDEFDTMNRMNQFPSNDNFQTFLLDKDNKVVAMGNPVHNPKVKELYLKIIMGDKAPKEKVSIQTTVACNAATVDMGTFDWKEPQTGSFQLTNTGDYPLEIIDVATSCGCTAVVYDKKPVAPGRITELKVHYKADHPGYFNKAITVHCNVEASPVKLRINGSAQ